MALFDVNVGLGRFACPVGRDFDLPGDLATEMKRLRIDEALVYHAVAVEADVRSGNALLSAQLDGVPGLHASWVMAPEALGGLPSPSEWVAEAVAAAVRAVRLRPRHSLYEARPWRLGPLLEALDAAGLPVLLDFGRAHWSERVIPWDAVRDVCLGRPGLPVIVIGTTVGDAGDAVAVLRETPNLHLECHALIAPDALDVLAQAGFGGRLLFGTGLPDRAGECAVGQILASGLGDTAACNARRLFGLPSPEATPLPPAGRLRPAGAVIDVHGHAGAWERTWNPVRTAGAMINSMHRCHVDKLVVSSFTAVHGETRRGNDEIAQIVAQYPERLYGYCVINPNYPEETTGELGRCFDDAANFVGIKLHGGLHGAPLQHAHYEPALAFAHEHRLPVLVHGDGDDEWAVVAERHTGASIIIAHACTWDGRSTSMDETLDAVRDVPNLYVDVAGSAAHRGALRALVDRVGAKKVLYGSDFPMFDLGFETGRVTFSDLDVVTKVQILGGNALRIFETLG